ncbi:hypothetical protein [Cellulomonas sp. PhB150]|uniref:hypothetical protein n=1 Tax=Cellulomonas sp. PhB150 TaxID=2485188 RepID=UPI000F9AAC3F|nr:hypothetical protein [Cellulomonas sp. PhB150]ROS31638.1 hypothetical protein EDF34_1301 [Cellulomonas sp. PhB150]
MGTMLWGMVPRGRLLVAYLVMIVVAVPLMSLADAWVGSDWSVVLFLLVVLPVAKLVAFKVVRPAPDIRSVPNPTTVTAVHVTLVDVGPNRTAVRGALMRHRYEFEVAKRLADGIPSTPIVVASGLSAEAAEEWRRDLEKALAVVAIGPATA